MNFIYKLAKNWKAKVFVQNLIGLLPGQIGFNLNEQITKKLRGSITHRQNPIPRIIKGIKNFALIYEQTGFNFKDKRILELGTGWHGIDLILFRLMDAKKIYTIDQHNHLKYENIITQLDSLVKEECLNELKRFNVLKENVLELRRVATKCTNLDEILDLLRVKYFIATPKKISKLDLEFHSIDLFYSESVLQRIPENDLKNMIEHIAGKILAKNSVFFHRTDQQDINSQNHADDELWSLNYLRYSKFFFNFLISGKFNSQNRLRESDFIEIFNSYGMNTTFVESYYKSDDEIKIKNFNVSSMFKKKNILDLITVHSKIIGTTHPDMKKSRNSLKRKYFVS